MKALVTGGAGFIGSHLVTVLAAHGYDVNVLDNLSTGRREQVHAQATFHEGDILDPDDLHRAMKGCRLVFHLAALTGSDDLDFKTNLVGSENVFATAKEFDAKIIFASSAAVYGSAFPCNEGTEVKPISVYGKSKLRAERLLGSGHFAARLFNVYGSRGKGAVNIFCRAIPAYEDVTIYGTGMQTRDFVHVDDVIRALLLGIDRTGVYNVGTGAETSLLTLVDSIGAAANATPRLRFALPRQDDIMRSRADISAISVLGWKPRVTLEEGIRQLL